jgi:hypothetical protein
MRVSKPYVRLVLQDQAKNLRSGAAIVPLNWRTMMESTGCLSLAIGVVGILLPIPRIGSRIDDCNDGDNGVDDHEQSN